MSYKAECNKFTPKQVSKATALGLTHPIPQVISFDTLLLKFLFL